MAPSDKVSTLIAITLLPMPSARASPILAIPLRRGLGNYQTVTYNAWPTAGTASYSHAKGLSLKIYITNLLAHVTGAVAGKTLSHNSNHDMPGATVLGLNSGLDLGPPR
jgi:hypothetical protein